MIIDTNALSAIIDGDPTIKSTVQHAASVEISVITLGEYRYGVLNGSRTAAGERWLRTYLRYYDVLHIDEETSRHYAELRFALKRSGTPIPSNDLWIAALGRQHELPVLSRDQHFDAVPGVRRITW